MAFILNNTGQGLWLRNPNGMVTPIAIGSAPVALAVAGNYDISTAPLQNTAALPVVPNILITNRGAAPLNLAAQGPLNIAAFKLAPNGGAFVLGNAQYNIT